MLSIDFAEVHRLATVKGLIEPLRRAFGALDCSPERAHYDLGNRDTPGTLLVMPAWREAAAIGVKITTVFPRNPERGEPSIAGAYLLLEWSTGKARALIDGRALTLLRTAAVSAVAADLLAPPDPRVLLMVGTGALSRYFIEGHLAVRRYDSVLLWGRNFDKTQTVAAEFEARGVPVRAQRDLEKAARCADVISCATMSDTALIKGDWLKEETHLDLVGSFKPTMRETDEECFRHSLIVVDTLDALRDSGDLIGPLAKGIVRESDIMTLKELVNRHTTSPRPRRTVFKSVGVALADLATAEHLVEQANHRPA